MFANPRTSTTQCSQTTTMASRSARCFFFSEVFEVAAFLTANPEGKIILHPLTIEIAVTALFVACALGTMFYQAFITAVGADPGARSLVLIPALLPSLGAIRILRRQSFMRRVLLTQLRNFDVDRAECRNDFDRHYIEAGKKRVRKKRHECKGSLCPLTHSSWFVQIIENIWKYIEIHWNISCIEIVNIYIYSSKYIII